MKQVNQTFSGRELREAGMRLAIQSANEKSSGWSDEALNALRMYIRANPDKQFMAEDVRNYAYDVLAVPYPAHCRAWGSVMTRAAREGLIKRVCIAPVKTPSSHMANASVWVKA